MIQNIFKSSEKGLKLEKGMIVALLLGVAMIYLPAFFRSNSSWMWSWCLPSIQFDLDLMIVVQPVIAVVGILLLNKNWKLALGALAVYFALVLYNFSKNSFAPFLFTYYIDWKYIHFSYAHFIELLFVIGAIWGINKNKRLLAKVSAILFAIWEITWVIMSKSSIYFYGDDLWSDLFIWTGFYCELLLPVILLVCAFVPRLIRNSIKIIDGYLAVRLMLFVGGDLLQAISGHGSWTHMDLIFLANICWLPLILILGLNCHLLFPLSFRELAKVFGFSLLVIGYITVIAMAAQSSENARRDAEERRDEYLNEMRNNILSWKEAGFSQGFTIDAARSLLNEGRISLSEYNWLVQEFIEKC